jgi:hypothetical protein
MNLIMQMNINLIIIEINDIKINNFGNSEASAELIHIAYAN